MSTDVDPDGDAPHEDETDRTVRLQEIYLPVHGYVRLYPEEVAIVNHPAFQRLRRCRQLGFAHVLMPGAVHTRFEHCIGDVHVAEKMIQYVNSNHRTGKSSTADNIYEKCPVPRVVKRFIRLGALLHDIGHLPLGHTLEDELDHLEKHDGEARIYDVAETAYPDYSLDCKACEVKVAAPLEGWSLHALVDALYHDDASKLGTGAAIKPFVLLKHIMLKPPSGEAQKLWDEQKGQLAKVFPVDFSRDVIGNTICADFLDYLYRDWFHIGKPIQEDRRLYAYMEARIPKRENGEKASPNAMQFVINVDSGPALRHDALTNIFELLEFRYKLFETVLFHRSKLALTALLDRSLLELRALYQGVKLAGNSKPPVQPEKYLQQLLVNTLLQASDDELPAIIERLALGWSPADGEKLGKAAQVFKAWSDALIAPKPLERSPLEKVVKETFASKPFDVVQRQQLIKSLAQGIANRTIYTLAARVPRRSFHPKVDVINFYNLSDNAIPSRAEPLREPEKRLQYLLKIESLLGLPRGTALVYIPAQAAMSAKIAEVKLLIDNEIVPFLKYELRRGDDSLTGGALKAQVSRFFHLWGASVYIRKDEWQKVPDDLDLRDTLRQTLDVSEEEVRRAPRVTEDIRKAATSVRRIMEQTMTAHRTLQAYQQDGDDEEFAGTTFPSGLSYPF